jgi:hypothetical protein
MKPISIYLVKAIFVLITTLSAGSFTRAQKLATENLRFGQVFYVGTDQDNRLIFELQLTNLPEKGNVLRISDEDRILFEERINAKTYRRRYKIDRSELNKIYFEVINGQTLLKETFQLNYKVEEKWEVIKA